jgi:hypothetical protein
MPNRGEVPVDSLRTVAIAIEQAVQSGNRTPNIGDRDGIVVSSDLVRQAIRTRAARAELVNAFRDTGNGIERQDGLLYIQRTKEYKKSKTGREQKRDALVVLSENNDRWTIYETLQRDGKWGRGSLDTIRTVFHEARVACMPDGQKYEDPSGNERVKGQSH